MKTHHNNKHITTCLFKQNPWIFSVQILNAMYEIAHLDLYNGMSDSSFWTCVK